MMIPSEQSLLVSSDPLNGARNISADGSSFEIQLSPELHIPAEAKGITVAMETAQVWWTVSNVDSTNNKFYITAPDANDVSTAYTVTIPNGLYNLSALNTAILRELSNQGAKSGVVSLSPDEATQRVNIRINTLLTSIDFTQANTVRFLLGFDAVVLGAFATVPVETLASNVAQFDTIQYFQIHTDLISNGIRTNNAYTQTIGNVLIDRAPGRNLISTPFNPARIASNELADAKRTTIRFWLTDQRNKLVNTNSEYWSARIVIRYLIPV